MKRVLSIFLAVLLVILQVPNIGFASMGGNSNENPPIEPIEMPNLIITSSNVYKAEAGESISVSVELKNTSDYYATNITGSLSSKSTDVYVDGRSYDDISSIRGGRTSSLSFKVKIDESAEGGNYELPLTVSYYNDYGDKANSLTGTINIRVSQNKTSPQLVVNRVDIMPSSTVNAGETIAVGFDIENIGSNVAKDIRITLNELKNDGFTLAKGVNYKTVQSLEVGKKKNLCIF